jgi:hypothetical protein
MYNMDISIFGFKLNLEILILIGVVYLILVGHTLCGCSNYSLMEGLETIGKVALASDASNNPANGTLATDISNNLTNGTLLTQASTTPGVSPAGAIVAGKVKNGSGKVNGKAGKEGFVGANTNFGQSSPYDLTNNSTINTSSWSKPNMTVVPGQPLSQGVKDFLAREPQPVPLPEGEMLMFANTPFKPECCPNTYSTSTGCACATSQQYNYLITRGGNNVPYSEY